MVKKSPNHQNYHAKASRYTVNTLYHIAGNSYDCEYSVCKNKNYKTLFEIGLNFKRCVNLDLTTHGE